MKIIIQHRDHQPSPFFTDLVEQHIESLREDLHIDEARILIEHRHEASPPFRVTAHLVTPGPDLLAEGIDHTLLAALQTLANNMRALIEHRQQKRMRSIKAHSKTAPSVHLNNTRTHARPTHA